jgi:Ca-activated chloride channel family protein
MYRFQHPTAFIYLMVVPILVLLFLWYLKWRKQSLHRLGYWPQIKTLISGFVPGRSTTQFLMLISTILLLVLGLANLQRGDKQQTIDRKGIDIVFALDISKSMLAQDVRPDRLTKAKDLMMRIMDKMANNRVGVVVFAGNAYLQAPLTVDYAAVKMLLNNANPSIISNQGTALGAALELSNSCFSSKEKKYKALVLITDGEDHDATALEEAQKAADEGVLIYTIGVGSAEGITIKDNETGEVKVDATGAPVITKLNEKILEDIADEGNGKYYPLENINQTANAVISNLNAMESQSLGTASFTNFSSYFQYFIGLAILLLMLEWLMPKFRSPKVKLK